MRIRMLAVTCQWWHMSRTITTGQQRCARRIGTVPVAVPQYHDWCASNDAYKSTIRTTEYSNGTIKEEHSPRVEQTSPRRCRRIVNGRLMPNWRTGMFYETSIEDEA
ncbi:hypothetical protein BC827DRAFT_168734 [Russula dissimulans]|nr:hypothetical protein BC827DRAFT_168734 [Russula dissimulans]